MIVGLGIDIVEVGRIRTAMGNPRFAERILTDAERNDERVNDPTYVAGRWAAKEAAHKAWPMADHWHDVEVISDPAPRMAIRGLPDDLRALVSITHERSHAVAVVIIEKK